MGPGFPQVQNGLLQTWARTLEAQGQVSL
jgi:hypothetical protein